MNPVVEDINPAPQTRTEEESVRLWRKRITDAKNYFEPDYKRMRENMEFAANIQWAGQEEMQDKAERYICNFITHHVNQKVASLYARDPKCEAKRRHRLDYMMWDEKVESKMEAQMVAASMPFSPQGAQAQMLLQDIAQGDQWKMLCDRIGKTLEILYGYQCDTQSPSFKFQMKQLVRRVITTGVGYVRLNFVRNFDHVLSSTLTDDSLAFRLKRVKAIVAGVEDDKIQEDDPRIEQMRLLLESVESSVKQGDMTNIEERIEFDFPSATSIIVDPRCKTLKGFIGASWVAQEYILPLDEANTYFELRGNNAITTGGEFVQISEDGQPMVRNTDGGKDIKDVAKEPRGRFWEVFDLTTKDHFFICDGWKSYVQAPQPLEPSINRFWPLFSLTFNDVEVETGQKCHIYPPSDVQLLKPMQRERNRIHDELEKHREVNRPFFWAKNGCVSEGDVEKFKNHETGELLMLDSPPMGANGTENIADAIGKWTGVPIDPNLYNTQPLDQDVSIAVGSNQAQTGMPQRHVAATPAVIQEQARMSDVNSNVDDLDDLLSELAQSSGEMMLRTFSTQTVQRIVGRGAAWPEQQREDFLNEIYLDIIAASSGRPNKAVEIANFERIAPLIMQALMNPLLWPIVKEAIKRLDDRLDIEDFLPTFQQQMMMQMNPMQQGGGQPQQQGRGNPPHQATGEQKLSANPMPGVAR